MTRLHCELDQVFDLHASVDVVRGWFSDLDRIAAATPDAERVEKLGPDTLRIVIREQRHGPHVFQPDFVVRYRFDGDEVCWKTLDGNFVSEGHAVLLALGTRTRVDYHHLIAFELHVPGVLAALLQPLVAARMRPTIARFVADLTGEVEAVAG